MTKEYLTKQSKLALLIPAHNEAMVLTDTIQGAIQAGVKAKDIYVVNDSSSDDTEAIAKRLLGQRHVLSVQRAGKALALKAGIEHFKLIKKYEWVQIIDADSVFSVNYFSNIRSHFQPGVAAVCGQVKSLQNNWITSFRAMEYTIFQDFYKTLQSQFNMIGVMPGPATCFNTKVLSQLDFSNDTLTEDFDMTIQVHRRQLGRIIYVQTAHSWTQDPPTLPIYIKQISRWYTGFFQVMKKYKVGSRLKPVDIMLLLQTLDGFFYAIQIAVLAIITQLHIGHIDLRAIIASDFLVLFVLASYAALRMRRIDIITPLPLYYVLRLVSLVMFIWAAIKVFIFPDVSKGGMWNTTRISHQSTALAIATKGGDV